MVFKESRIQQYRSELLSEMKRSIKYAIDHDHTPSMMPLTILERMQGFRRDIQASNFCHHAHFLSKGLEFDCVIIDMTTPLSAKDFYVAMTRAMRKIYIISDTSTFSSKTNPFRLKRYSQSVII